MTGRGHEAGSPSHETTELRQEQEPRTQAVADMLLKRRPVRRELPRRRRRRPGHGPIGRGGQRVVWCHRHALPVVRLQGCRALHIRSGGRHSKGDGAGATGTRGDRGHTTPSIGRRSVGEADVRVSSTEAWPGVTVILGHTSEDRHAVVRPGIGRSLWLVSGTCHPPSAGRQASPACRPSPRGWGRPARNSGAAAGTPAPPSGSGSPFRATSAAGASAGAAG